ncbi:MAG: WbuC family cupin fold metalloprotein [Thermoanaerobaculia bacterium]
MRDETTSIHRLERHLLTELSAAARLHPRKRLNRNLHAMDDPTHRLLNAIEPGSYVRPHRHLSPPKSETVIVVSGALGLLLFDETGLIVGSDTLEAGGERFGADLAPGAWHSIVSLAAGTVFFECKPGPYVRPAEADLAPWSPEEGSEEAAAIETVWRTSFLQKTR